MDKKEKEMRLENHVAYFDLVDTIKEMSLNALDQNLSVSDIVSVLDRVKVVLLQQEVMVIMEETQDETDEGVEDDDKAMQISHIGVKSAPSINAVELDDATNGMYI